MSSKKKKKLISNFFLKNENYDIRLKKTSSDIQSVCNEVSEYIIKLVLSVKSCENGVDPSIIYNFNL